MPTKRQQDADRLDHALFMAHERLIAFKEAHPHAFSPRPLTGDESALKAYHALLGAISTMRHYHVRPMMDEKQREATSG